MTANVLPFDDRFNAKQFLCCIAGVYIQLILAGLPKQTVAR